LVLHNYIPDSKPGRKAKKVYLVIENYPESSITDIKANMIENFIKFEAVVLKVYQAKLMAVSLEFDCPDCKASFSHYLIDGVYSQPSKCRGGKKDCHCRMFILKKDKIRTTFIQRLKVQEIDSEDRTPRQVMCELR
jgi:DNA replicative helicase MCM subunit Mcm2 (Cdc46/Mcm family)